VVGNVSAGDEHLLLQLCKLLKEDTDASVRAAAASSLAALSHDETHLSSQIRESVEALLRGLEDQEPWVRLASERALGICVHAMCTAEPDEVLAAHLVCGASSEQVISSSEQVISEQVISSSEQVISSSEQSYLKWRGAWQIHVHSLEMLPMQR
jgi:HEAT repeat protein